MLLQELVLLVAVCGVIPQSATTHDRSSTDPWDSHQITSDAPFDEIVLPNDPSFIQQWYCNNTGQRVQGTDGAFGADAGVFSAWQLLGGSLMLDDRSRPGPIVAVIDAGVSESHPDLAGRLLPGLNLSGGPSNDTDDGINSHGTAVAGIIAGVWNNERGIAGIAPQARILPVKIFNPLGFGSADWAAEGLRFAVERGADVVVMSFGFEQATDNFRQAVLEADAADVIMIASTGNIASAPVPFPAAWPEVIAVGASDQSDGRAVFSGGGPEIDLVAPGVNILTTADTPTIRDGYRYETGTSFAAPVVGGVAALIRQAHPELPASTVRDVLLGTADDLAEAGWDEETGFGRVNALSAVTRSISIRECDADVNQDGELNALDFSAWLEAFNNNDPRADQNKNGTVDPTDFGAWLSNYIVGCDYDWSDI